jgi:hypothetical protein
MATPESFNSAAFDAIWSSYMRIRTVVCLASILAANLLVAQSVAAQGLTVGREGQAVSIKPPDSTTWRGRLLAPLSHNDVSAVICRGRLVQCEVDSTRIIRLARADGVSLQLRTGSNWGKGALIGGVTGAALATTWSLLYHLDDASSAEDGRAGRIVIGTAAITAVGALIGGLIGSRSEHWDPVWQ